ncbi:hypothetical protein K461DRAFT_272818 [Myriangium duriaei CBS 260.36]|uniref:Uncharacterized protein n=1 Tax=Myriangium duriaei CBS 260.36 TaxID=1168546 RepID=A0A9P4JB23_9PEZI|nr:hypothetical protein K461DRAFT_272818 [Myriangium duriaei CBS 260.36]
MDSSTPPDSPRARSSTISSLQSATRSVMSASNRVLEAPVPLGMWAATAQTTSTAPTVSDIRRGSYSVNGWEAAPQENEANSPQFLRRASRSPSLSLFRRASTGLQTPIAEEKQDPLQNNIPQAPYPGPLEPIASEPVEESEPFPITPNNPPMAPLGPVKSYPNGYIEPPKQPWTVSTKVALLGFWRWFLTPFGFLVTLYGLNVVAWGGMLFLLLCGAAPKMCSPNLPSNDYNGCNDIQSPRRKWLEVDSQILNALFCVTGFGLIPWRFRDLYFLLRWRLASSRGPTEKKLYGLRKLAGIHNGWFRLPGSDTLDELSADAYRSSLTPNSPSGHDAEAAADDFRLPIPLSKSPPPPLTGVRASPTRVWLLDFVIWANVWNTFLQACLCGFMWGMNRYNRPSWSTGLFIAAACVVAGAGGIVMFVQGKRVKRCEGVPPEGWNGEEVREEGLERGVVAVKE